MREIKSATALLNVSDDKRETFDMILELADEIAIDIEEYAREIDEFGAKLENGKVVLHERAHHFIEKVRETGLYALPIPEKYDGAELPFALAFTIFERLARADAGLSLNIGLSQFLVDAIVSYGTDEAKELLLTEFAQGKRNPAVCLSEPTSGSDLGSVRSKIELDGDRLVVNGQKIWMSNAGIGDTILFLGRTGSLQGTKGLTACIIDLKNSEGGAVVERLEDKLGLHSNPTGVINLENVEVPRENLLGEIGGGYPIILRCLTSSRIGIASQAIGIAEAAYRKTLEYVKQREQFNQKLAYISAIQQILADMKIGLIVGRASYIHAASLQDLGKPFSTEGASAKVYCSEVANKICFDAIQLHGGYGYVRDYDVERYYRDVRVTTIYEGANQIQRMIIATNEIKGRHI